MTANPSFRPEQGETPDTRSCHRILHWHLGRYPLMETGDLVKLAYQACFGNLHLGHSGMVDRKEMEREALADHPPPDRRESLLEPLSTGLPIRGWVRVNLRPWMQRAGRTAGELAQALAVRPRDTLSGRQQFQVWMSHLDTFLQKRSAPLPGKSLDSWNRFFQDREYPPIHHSARYRRAYRPAYRVAWFPFINPILSPGRQRSA